MLHIKLTGMRHRTPCRQIFCPFILPQSLGGVKRSKYFFSEGGHVAYQKERSIEHYASKMFDLMHTPDLLGWVK